MEAGVTKRAQTTPDTSFGPLVSILLVFFDLFDTNLCFITYIVYEIYDRERIRGRRRRKRAQRTHLVSFGPSFFSFFHVFFLLLIIFRYRWCFRAMGWLTVTEMTKTGPNSKFFFVFYITNYYI
jgi:sterol desaturase/sphingolipid hydroxylase (fatty acid hydroxylase superfamily)